MGIFQKGSKHPNWKGGKSISSHGYVLIRMPYHPRAHKNGYVYEHVLVAEKKLGRPLKKGEIIHHKDEIKTNNSPDNISITKSIAHHKANHRKSNSYLRLPDEKNPVIKCKCGCGKKFKKYDSNGRPRSFVYGGHSRRKLTSLKISKIMELLDKGYPKTKVAKILGVDRNSVYKAMRLNNGIK